MDQFSQYTEAQEQAHRKDWRQRKFSVGVLLVVLAGSWIAFFAPGVREGLDTVAAGWGELVFGLWSLGLMAWARWRLRCPGCQRNTGEGLVVGRCSRCGLVLELNR